MIQNFLKIGTLFAVVGFAQTPPDSIPQGGPPAGFPGGFPFGGRGPGGPGGPSFPGMGGDRKLVKQFDKDGDGRLNREERTAARELLTKESAGRPQMPFMRGRPSEPPKPGAKLTPAEVRKYGSEPIYDPTVVRTLFFEFEDADWEKEMAAFYRTDVEVPAKLTVDGKIYSGVGIHFRGMSSFMMVGEGRKRSLNVSLDYTQPDQRLGGYRTLNLLNAHEDPSFLRTVLYMQIARNYVPAPRANFVRVVINGENWGIYTSAEQYNGDFVKERFGSNKGTRWKVPGSPFGRGGLSYIGEDAAAYKKVYEIKTKDDPKAWAALIALTKTLTETPIEKLEAAVDPILDIDGALKFLAVEKTLINNDGYWTRASDYSIYLDEKGKFHLIPHDGNETLMPAITMGPPGGFGPGGPGGPLGSGPNGPPQGFPGSGSQPQGTAPGSPEGGPQMMPFPPPDGQGMPGGFPGSPGGARGGPGGQRGGPGGPRGGDVKLDPFAGSNDPNKVLLHRLLAVPALRTRYLDYVRQIAREWLDWNKLGPIATQYHSLIAADVKADTRKLESTDAFLKSLTEDTVSEGQGPFGGRPVMSLKTFVTQRREFLLNYVESKAVPATAKLEE